MPTEPDTESDIRNRTVDLLRRELTDDQPVESRWMTTARWLYQLDPAELEKVIQDPSLTIKPAA